MLDPEPNRLRRRLAPIVICVLLGSALGAWHSAASSSGRSDPVTSLVRTLFSPVIGATRSATSWMASLGQPFASRRDLLRQNASLRRQVAALSEETARLREAASLAERLSRQLGFLTATPGRKVPAHVVALMPSAHFATLVIDRGRTSGVRAGNVVVTPEGLAGHVYEVTPTTASVILLTDPNAAAGALVQRPASRAVGVCRGDGDGMLSMHYLSREADVRRGDTIVTSGLGGEGGVYPKGLVIGVVVAVKEDLAASAKVATVRPSVPLDRLEEVMVLQ